MCGTRRSIQRQIFKAMEIVFWFLSFCNMQTLADCGSCNFEICKSWKLASLRNLMLWELVSLRNFMLWEVDYVWNVNWFLEKFWLASDFDSGHASGCSEIDSVNLTILIMYIECSVIDFVRQFDYWLCGRQFDVDSAKNDSVKKINSQQKLLC